MLCNKQAKIDRIIPNNKLDIIICNNKKRNTCAYRYCTFRR